MQLRQAEALGVLDHHQRGIGHVHAHFDHGGGHQHLHAVGAEIVHHGSLLGRRQASVHQAHAQVRQCRHQRFIGLHRGLQLQRLAFLDQRADPVDLAAFGGGVMDASDHFVAPLVVDQARDDGGAARRQFIDHRHIEVGVVSHGERARDRRGRHHQLVRHGVDRGHRSIGGTGLAAQRQPLRHAEAVLLVDH
ncbi:hypothetical protein D9M72_489410 [compost metagenome]